MGVGELGWLTDAEDKEHRTQEVGSVTSPINAVVKLFCLPSGVLEGFVLH